MTSLSTRLGACKNMETEFPQNAKCVELNFWAVDQYKWKKKGKEAQRLL